MTTCVICKHRELTDDRPQVCAWCQERVSRQLRLIEVAAPFLAIVASNEPTSAGKLDLTAVDLTIPGNPVIIGAPVDQIGQMPAATRLAQWAEDWSGRDILTADAASVAQFLRRGLRWACAAHPAIDEFARDLRQIYTALRVALHRDLRGRRFAAPCPHCGLKTLIRPPGADWIECGPCEALYDDDDYATVVLAQVPDEALLSAQQAATIAGVATDTVYQWVKRGKLTPVPGPWGGRRLFLRSDVDQVWKRTAPRVRERVAA